MKKAIIVGISLSLLILFSPIKNNSSQYTSTVAMAESSTNINVHPILPPVG
ncbi:hypothetical protein [Neobacillus niacini]|uniref:hypothetical protein n=1 Tax=Neobacillus niacini TaxID=86668 RepID=UPI0020412B93|nr:hypothetical protein [Neobacillus niacini]MCM3691557.1 hypothetical protein [Neobacillus niacini]